MIDAAWKDFIAGYAGGLTGLVIGNPLDVIKVRLQDRTIAPLRIEEDIRPTTSNVQALYREGGISRLFLGVTAPILGLAFLNGVLFTSYGYFLKRQNVVAEANDLTAVFLAGAGAGLASVLITNPVELIKCREQVSRSPRTSLADLKPTTLGMIKSIYKTEGLSGFYVATMTTAARDAIGYGFYFASYEAAKQLLDRSSQDPSSIFNGESGYISATKILIAGGVAGIASWSSVYPLDSVKTILQSSSMDSRPASAFEVTMMIWRNGGIPAFYNGLWPTMVRALVVNAVTFFTYESVFKSLSPNRKP